MTRADVAIIGGTGFYRLMAERIEEVELDTPYGKPSASIVVSDIAGKRLAFLPRHGKNHDFLPSEVPYRANLWALKEIGVRQVIGFNTVGSLQRTYRRGDLALVDQFVDRTWGRTDTFFSGTTAAHISSAKPYCSRMRKIAYEALSISEPRLHRAATVVVVQGPRFSTAAESRWFSGQGWHLVNMTQYPEAVLARELELCYANLSYVTDYDVAAAEVVGDDEDAAEPVSHAGVLNAFGGDSERVQNVVQTLVAALPADADCTCRHALDGART